VIDGKGVEVASGVGVGMDACVGLDLAVAEGGDVGEGVKGGMGEDNWQPVMLIASRIAREIFPCHSRLLVLFIIKSSILTAVNLIGASFHITLIPQEGRS
jgi:hypothetical protein